MNREHQLVCGIFGAFSLSGRSLPPIDSEAALQSIYHRGPDDVGLWQSRKALLGVRRLSIIDPVGGHQPMTNESGNLRIVMNGEIFGYEALFEQLVSQGHLLHSRCDTEVALHLFEGPREQAIARIDGQYALALHDSAANELLLLRDRTGIAPLFYCIQDGVLVFASEMKALFASRLIAAKIDVRSLDAVTAFGCIPFPRTLFQGVRSLPAGHYLLARQAPNAHAVRIVQYWDIPYPQAGEYERRKDSEWAEELHAVLEQAVNRRLRSDVPVGLYLSGGIDSSSVGALLKDFDGVKGRVYSIGFPERRFDESRRTHRVAEYLSLREQYLRYTQDDLARDFPRLLYHAEAPLISTESVPLFALSGLAAREVKVILTGEGSDEGLGGYDYFLRDAVLQGFDGNPLGRTARAAVRLRVDTSLGRDNPVFPTRETLSWAEEVFGFYPAGAIQMFYWRKIRSMTFSDGMIDRIARLSDAELVDLPMHGALSWDPLNRSLYVSSRIFLQGHLLAAHGDRALMAHSVEGRYPFLDRTVQELLSRVPPRLKIRMAGFQPREKYLLRKAMSRDLPAEVLRRRKKPFLAPFGTPFARSTSPQYVRELLSAKTIRETGFFDEKRVATLQSRLQAAADDPDGGLTPGLSRSGLLQTVDGMALAFVLSVQLLAHMVESNGFTAFPADLP